VRSARIAFHVLKRLPWPFVVASAAGWALLAALAAAPPLPALCLSAASIGEGAAVRLALALDVTGPAILSLTWLAMLLAMMPPLVASPLLHVWHRSLPRRRGRAVALFVTGYACVWLVGGALLALASLALGGLALVTMLPPLALASLVLLAWHMTPLRQLCLNRCHRKPSLSAFGLHAETDSFGYGASHGVWCVGTCWALMVLPLTTGGLLHAGTMLAVTFVSMVERVRPPRSPVWGIELARMMPARLPIRGIGAQTVGASSGLATR
jgi:predicted metal-binding membrane protein